MDYKLGVGSLVGFIELAGIPLQEGDQELIGNVLNKRYPPVLSKPESILSNFDYREYKDQILGLLSDNPQVLTRALRFWGDALEKGKNQSKAQKNSKSRFLTIENLLFGKIF